MLKEKSLQSAICGVSGCKGPMTPEGKTCRGWHSGELWVVCDQLGTDPHPVLSPQPLAQALFLGCPLILNTEKKASLLSPGSKILVLPPFTFSIGCILFRYLQPFSLHTSSCWAEFKSNHQTCGAAGHTTQLLLLTATINVIFKNANISQRMIITCPISSHPVCAL